MWRRADGLGIETGMRLEMKSGNENLFNLVKCSAWKRADLRAKGVRITARPKQHLRDASNIFLVA